MLPLLIAAGIGLVAGAAAASGGTQETHTSNHKHVHLHVQKKPKSSRGGRKRPNQKAKRITTNLYNFSKSNALPPGERRAVHKAIAVVKRTRLNKGKRYEHVTYWR
jgi:hypothetical protein